MRTVHLFMDHREHKDGKMIHYKAGEVVELPDEVADYIASAVVQTRVRTRERAIETPGTVERKARG